MLGEWQGLLLCVPVGVLEGDSVGEAEVLREGEPSLNDAEAGKDALAPAIGEGVAQGVGEGVPVKSFGDEVWERVVEREEERHMVGESVPPASDMPPPLELPVGGRDGEEAAVLHAVGVWGSVSEAEADGHGDRVGETLRERVTLALEDTVALWDDGRDAEELLEAVALAVGHMEMDPVTLCVAHWLGEYESERVREGEEEEVEDLEGECEVERVRAPEADLFCEPEAEGEGVGVVCLLGKESGVLLKVVREVLLGQGEVGGVTEADRDREGEAEVLILRVGVGETEALALGHLVLLLVAVPMED